MKISKSAWHYRYMGFFGFSRPGSLCPYFWKLMFCLLVPIAGVAALGGILIMLGAIAIVLYHNLAITLTILGIVSTSVAIIITTLLLTRWLNSIGFGGRIAQTRVMVEVGSGMSLTGEYIGAAHRRVCPLLEFTEE